MTPTPLRSPGQGQNPGRPTRGGASRLRELAGTGVGFVAVVVVCSLVLQGLDRIPGLLAGLPRGVTRVPTMAALERELGASLPLPVYYPDDLTWPPADLWVYPGRSAVAIVHASRSSAPALIIGKSAPGLSSVPPPLLPPVTVLQSSESTFGTRRATVARVQDAAGALWHQVSWSDHGRAVVARYRGDLQPLFRMIEGMAR